MKKDVGIRVYVEYRKSNQVARFDAYPKTRIKEISDTVSAAKVISTLALAKVTGT